MKLPFIVHPDTKQRDPMLTMSILVILAATGKFLLEGISMTVLGHMINFGHADAGLYGALLVPVLGAHGYLHAKRNDKKEDLSIEAK